MIYNKIASLKARCSRRYQELFEGVGDQLVARLLSPISSQSSIQKSNIHQPPIDNSTFKQIAGCITLVYVLLIGIFSVCLGLAYTFWPEERVHHTNLIFLIVLSALIFGICLIAFCAYARLYQITGNIRAYSPQPGVVSGHQLSNGLGSVAYGRDVKIQITSHPGYNKVEKVPMWENTYEDLQDSAPDYDRIRNDQRRQQLQFLKHID